MAWDFPTTSTVGQQFSPLPGVTYSWNGYAWDLQVPGMIGNVLLATRVASNSPTIDFIGLLDATYDEYEVHFFGAQLANNNDTLVLRVGQSGVILTASNYYFSYVVANLIAGNYTVQPALFLTQSGNVSNSAIGLISGRIRIAKPSSSNFMKNIQWETAAWTASGVGAMDTRGSGMWAADTNPIDSLRFYAYSAGNIVNGTFKLYGVR